jgi:hypothetical protein
MASAIFEMDAIGKDGALEAISVHYFCSDACQQKAAPLMFGPIELGHDDPNIDGLMCEQCNRLLER